MADYSQLDSLVQTLKKAAIDAYMVDVRNATIEGGSYKLMHAPNDEGIDVNQRASRPDDAGAGGGVYSDRVTPPAIQANVTAYQQEFDAIRTRIDNAVSPWRGLPDPVDVGKQVDSMRDVVVRLALSPDITDRSIMGTGELQGSIDMVEQDMDALTGATVAEFKRQFAKRMRKSVVGYHDVAVILMWALMVEQSLWKATRDKVAQIVDEAGQHMQEIAQGRGTNWPLIIEIGQTALDVVTAFAPPSKTLTLIGTGLSVLSAHVSPKDPASDAGGFEQAMSTFEQKLKEANMQVEQVETDVDGNLTTNASYVQDDQTKHGSYIPNEPGVSSGQGLYIEPGKVAEVVKHYLPDSAIELRSIGLAADSCEMSVDRADAIGLGPHGPRNSWLTLRNVLVNLCDNMAWQCSMAAEDLQDAVNDMQQHDAASAAALRKQNAALARGSGIQILVPFPNQTPRGLGTDRPI